MPPAVGLAIAGIASGVGTIYGAHKQASAAGKAADIQAKSDADALQFARDQEAQRQKEWQQTQTQNYQNYQNDFDYRKSLDAAMAARDAAQVSRRAPFVAAGTRSLGQFLTPIAQNAPPGSVGALLKR